MVDSKPWIGKNWLEKQSTSIESQTDLQESIESEVDDLDGQGFSKMKRIWLHISLLWKASKLQGKHKRYTGRGFWAGCGPPPDRHTPIVSDRQIEITALILSRGALSNLALLFLCCGPGISQPSWLDCS